MARRLERYDVKEEVTAALGKRAVYRRELYANAIVGGCGLIVLSGIGLFRENRIRRMRARLEGLALPGGA